MQTCPTALVTNYQQLTKYRVFGKKMENSITYF